MQQHISELIDLAKKLHCDGYDLRQEVANLPDSSLDPATDPCKPGLVRGQYERNIMKRLRAGLCNLDEALTALQAWEAPSGTIPSLNVTGEHGADSGADTGMAQLSSTAVTETVGGGMAADADLTHDLTAVETALNTAFPTHGGITWLVEAREGGPAETLIYTDATTAGGTGAPVTIGGENVWWLVRATLTDGGVTYVYEVTLRQRPGGDAGASSSHEDPEIVYIPLYIKSVS